MVEGGEIDGVVGFVERRVFWRVDRFGLRVVDRLCVTIRLREVLGVVRRMLVDGLRVGVLTDEFERDRRVLLRLVWVRDCEGRLTRGLTDRLGVLGRREIEGRLLRVGADRCGVGRELDRLGACRLL